jgi:hypothetical protein
MPTTASAATTQKNIAGIHSPLSPAGYNEFVIHGRSCNDVVVPFAEREAPMLRIYARVSAAVLALIAIAAAVRISRVGLGVSVLYLGSAAVFAYAGFSGRTSTIIRTAVAAMGLFFLVSGLLVAVTMSVLRFPFEGRGWESGLLHAAFGGLTMVCAMLLPCSDESVSR